MDAKKPNIICMGILDIKGDEIKFLAEEVEKAGGNPIIMEISLGHEVGWADIPLSELLLESGLKKEEVFKASRSDAISLVGKAGALKIAKLYEEKKIDGVISWAGSVGTSTATMVMRALPIGFPKIMLSTLASGDVSSWLGNKDIYIVNPISEKGVNIVTRKLIGNAAAAIVGMARYREVQHVDAKPLVALTAYGTTTPTVIKCEKYMHERGWDSIIIHQVGTGATMEDLIDSGEITAVYEITPGEISNNMYGSIYGIGQEWTGDRLTAASRKGIPQIVCPGGLDQSAYQTVVPEKYLKGFIDGTRVSYKNSKAPYIHNSAVTIMVPNKEETEELAEYVVSRLNKTTGPTALIVPMRGWSAYDQSVEDASVDKGWAKENGDGPVWWPDPDNPKWSKRATLMWDVFMNKWDRSNPNLDIIKCDNHILDTDFAELLNTCMGDMLDKKWNKGLYRELENVVE
ncbi:MAG: Tm-1-like ATP-binding domain-containing protein [Actinomycetota bacterium]|nr:Tm-1-like ATP-binding domain-containing protein [Actinomycetota bacterium]